MIGYVTTNAIYVSILVLLANKIKLEERNNLKLIIKSKECLCFDKKSKNISYKPLACIELRKLRFLGEEIGTDLQKSDKILPILYSPFVVEYMFETGLIKKEDYHLWNNKFTEKELLIYEIYKDLWKKGYYVTNGSKFGGDFLIYNGDPILYHSQYIVVCKQFQEEFETHQICSLGRLGNSVKKDVLLATKKDSGLEYLSISWNNLQK